MTRTDYRVLDAFTTACPYERVERQTYVINMHEEVNFNMPGSFKEYAFYNAWDNKVPALVLFDTSLGNRKRGVILASNALHDFEEC